MHELYAMADSGNCCQIGVLPPDGRPLAQFKAMGCPLASFASVVARLRRVADQPRRLPIDA